MVVVFWSLWRLRLWIFFRRPITVWAVAVTFQTGMWIEVKFQLATVQAIFNASKTFWFIVDIFATNLLFINSRTVWSDTELFSLIKKSETIRRSTTTNSMTKMSIVNVIEITIKHGTFWKLQSLILQMKKINIKSILTQWRNVHF